MRISPKYTINDWINLTFSTEEDWQKAVDIFEDRIHGRYLSIIAKIENCEYAGFVILALDCLLIETLQQFREGVEQTPYKKHEQYFKRFLTDTSFKNYFTEEELAGRFYQQIRNGILHQAEIKSSSRVSIRQNDPLVSPTEDCQGLIINRKRFHQQLSKVFYEYISSLRDSSNNELRKMFKKKMDYICRVNTE